MTTFMETYRAKAHGARIDQCPGPGHYCRACHVAATELNNERYGTTEAGA